MRRPRVAMRASMAVLALALLSGGAVVAQEKTEIAARNKALVAAGFDAWKSGQGSPFELLAVDATWTIVGHSVVAKTYDGREAFMTEVIRPFNARMQEGLKPVVHQILADGDRVTIL